MTDAIETLPRWSVADLHESFESRSFVDALEQVGADATRLVALFDEHDIRRCDPRDVTEADGLAADAVIRAFNDAELRTDLVGAYIYATVSTDSFDETAQGLLSEVEVVESQARPLFARLAEWVSSLGVDALASVSTEVAEHRGPLTFLAARAEHQMSEAEEGLYSELTNTGSSAWQRAHADVTSQLTGTVEFPSGTEILPMAAIRGLATDGDPKVREAAYDAEMRAWPAVAVMCAAAMNSVKGEANVVNRRRGWDSPIEASLFANNVSRATFDAMQSAVDDALPDLRRWMHAKARLHGRPGALPWYDLFAPLPFAASSISWTEGLEMVRGAFTSYSQPLGGLVDRAVGEQWIDAGAREGKRGGAFCMPFIGDRSLVFLNWDGSVDSAQTTAHELGHAYHNTQLAHRTALQRRLPMALAETASIFCETLVVEEGLQHLTGLDRLALLDVNLASAVQTVVDIRSRFIFETEVFARRQRRTLGVSELNEMMLSAQNDSYGDGLDQSTAHPYMWAVKPHYYGSHFYNWPYTYGFLFGLGLFAKYREDPQRFQLSYDDVLSRAGMNTAEELGAVFGFDVSDVAFWTASLDVLRGHIDQYAELSSPLAATGE
ncbi:MAG TPA: M3 family oligoendopeptidase [Ilumatobacteraceae bacterium]|jgi:pepF/M3 family oligoendopeptidase|nr:M3 family oligoendopeptidase [Ilumatobacteraceae bacterium]